MNFENLPFVKVAETGKVIDAWAVTPTGDYSADCETGRKFFRSLFLTMLFVENPTLLVRVLTDQARKFEQWGGIEAGFQAALTDELDLVP